VNLHRQGTHTTSEIAELFGVACSTAYRAIQRADGPAAATLHSEAGGAFTR
jgi:transposase